MYRKKKHLKNQEGEITLKKKNQDKKRPIGEVTL